MPSANLTDPSATIKSLLFLLARFSIAAFRRACADLNACLNPRDLPALDGLHLPLTEKFKLFIRMPFNPTVYSDVMGLQADLISGRTMRNFNGQGFGGGIAAQKGSDCR
jgi:hypothetical protein